MLFLFWKGRKVGQVIRCFALYLAGWWDERFECAFSGCAHHNKMLVLYPGVALGLSTR